MKKIGISYIAPMQIDLNRKIHAKVVSSREGHITILSNESLVI